MKATRRIAPAITAAMGVVLVMSEPAWPGDERGELIRPKDDTWLRATSVEDVLAARPEQIDLLLEALDLAQPGLRCVKAAVEAGDKAAACGALMDYYARDGRCAWIVERLPAPGDRHVRIADDVLQRKIHKGRTVGTIPVRNGAWDWNHTGPKGNREFAFTLNRHQVFPHLLLAWRKTGDEKYARAFDRIVRDWVLHTVYPGRKHQYVWTWRVLEAGLRMRTWLPAFHGFVASDAFTPAGRLLMLSSFVQHGRYIKMHHWNGHNHTLMEFDGLNRLALALPELKEAGGWHRYAHKRMLHEMTRQVYPDGAHNELSSGYHWVSLHAYEGFAAICRAAGREVPDDYRARLIDMYDYWAGLVRSDGSLPQNNRAGRSQAAGRLLAAAAKYGRDEWRYIATNGQEGSAPAGPPSRFAPYAGHLVCRSGWGTDALWSFFDAGPAGHGSVHADALHLSVTAYGKDFLIDSGRFWYMGDKWQRFAHSSRSHNVMLIDGCEQQRRPKTRRKPTPDGHWAVTEALDYARGTHEAFEGLDGHAAHTRIVVFLPDAGWVVVDRIRTDRPRTLTAMWRFRPERHVRLTGDGQLVTADGQGATLSLTPAGPVEWTVELVRGQENPHLQGWYSQVSTEWVPNTCAVCRAKIGGEAVFAWIILPTRAGPAAPAEDAACAVSEGTAAVRFTVPGGDAVRLRVPLSQGRPTREGKAASR
jgi:hypothetical protein